MLSMVVCLSAAACLRRAPGSGLSPLPVMPFATDTVRAERVGDGVVHRFIYSPTGPWAIHTLEVDLDQCTSVVAVKGADRAANRIKTTTMLGALAPARQVMGGVNGDFFSLANGTPVGMLVVDGRIFTPPVNQPVLAFDSAGVPHIDTFTLRAGALSPFYPRYAVGGRPLLIRDSVVVGAVDADGQASFNVGRNPRTAAGLARGGRRVIFAVIDGRQMPYSDGMSLRETAALMLALGARDAINLDGGGSSTLVYADPRAGGALRIANRVSDKGGERSVGDALAVVRTCQ